MCTNILLSFISYILLIDTKVNSTGLLLTAQALEPNRLSLTLSSTAY